VDRIMARHDFPRLACAQVREAALQAMGVFSELSPAAAAALGVSEVV
jgi:hypothetical protein